MKKGADQEKKITIDRLITDFEKGLFSSEEFVKMASKL